MKLFRLFSILVLSLLFFAGCDNDDENQTTTTNFSLNFDFNIDGAPFKFGDVYTINGTAVNFEIAQFYLGGVEFPKTSGTSVGFSTYLLVSPDAGAQEVGTLISDTYDKIAFSVGVLPEDNDQTETDFTSRSSEDPLSMKNPSMHWNWNSGYKFVRIDGLVDTDGDNTPETPMSFHLGTNQFLRSFDFQMPQDVNGEEQTLTFDFDVASLFTGIDLSKDFFTHTGDNMPLAEQFYNNLANAISLK